MAHVALGSASFGNAFETFPNKALGFAKGYLLTYYEKDAEMSRERLVGNQIGKSLSDAAERLPAFNRPVFFGLWRTLRAWLEIEAARSHPNAKPGDRGDQALITSLFNRIETAGALPPATAARMRRIKADATGFAQALSDLTPIMRAFAEYCHRDPSLRERTVQSLLAEYGRDPRLQTRVHRRLTKAGADTAVILAIDSVARLSLTDLNRLVGEKTAVGLFNEAPVHLEHIAQRLQAVAADGVRTTRSFEEQLDSNTNIIIDGEEVPLPTPGPYRLLLILIITAIMLIVEGVKIVMHLEHIAQRLQAVAADGVRTTRSFEEQFDSNTNIIIDGEEVPLPTPGPYRLLLILIITAIMLIVEGVKIVIYTLANADF